MRKYVAALLAAAGLVVLSGTAAARTNIDVGVTFGIPAPVYIAPRAPVYYHPAPVYSAPPPVYVAPAPVYYGPPAYYAPPVVYRDRGWHRGWRHHHRHHGHRGHRHHRH